MNIEPASGEGAAPSIHVERRQVHGFRRAGASAQEEGGRPYDNRPAKDPFLFWIPDDPFVVSESQTDESSPQTA